MADAEVAPAQRITIYLIKSRHEPEKLIQQRREVTEFEVPVGPGVRGTLYVKEGEPKPPAWARFFAGHVAEREFGKVSSSAAVLLVPARERLFAVTFGHGRYLLPLDSCEERFGLRVALNSIDEGKLRSIDKTIFEGSSRHSREQASRDMNARDFGLEIERDLLRGVTGTPRQGNLGKMLTGMDSLTAYVSVELEGLTELMSLYYSKSISHAYRKSFPWVDHIHAVSDPSTTEQLDSVVVRMIREKKFRRCWLAAPEIVEWSEIGAFRYSRMPRATDHYDLRLEDMVSEIRDLPNLDKATLAHKKIYCLRPDGTDLAIWPVYRCLYSEVDIEGKSYILTGGSWYQVARDFVTEVNDSFAKIPRYAGNLPEFDDDTETIYNKRVARENQVRFALMDRKLVKCAGMASPIEFCDLFSDRREIVHVKKYGGSDVLSHLFAQGTVSGEMFQMESDFREEVNAKLPPTFQLDHPKQRPNPGEYTVVLAVISRSANELDLPFFSRVSARHAVRRLQGYGYNAALAKVSVSLERKALQRVKPARMR